MAEATAKQIEFAKAISEKLGIPIPKGDRSAYWNFINNNKFKYQKAITQHVIRSYVSGYNGCLELKEYPTDNLEITQCFINALVPLTDVSGIYSFVKNGLIMYIGKSVNLGERIMSSFSERFGNYNNIYDTDIMFYPVPNKADVNILEIVLITENKPILNKESNCDDFPTMFRSGIDILKDFYRLEVVNNGNL